MAHLRTKDNQVFFESENYTGTKFGPMVLTRATKTTSVCRETTNFFYLNKLGLKLYTTDLMKDFCHFSIGFMRGNVIVRAEKKQQYVMDTFLCPLVEEDDKNAIKMHNYVKIFQYKFACGIVARD